MRGYENVRSHSFQYKDPFHNNYCHSSEGLNDFGDNFYKVVGSWLKFRDYLSIGSIAEVDKIRNVFWAVFQANQKQAVKKHKKAKTSHIVKVDLGKIDEKLQLSEKEKRRLKHILNQIKCREYSNAKPANQKEIKRRNDKPLAFKRTKKIVSTGNNMVRTRKMQTIEKPKERKICGRCDCSQCSMEVKPLAERQPYRLERRHMTPVTPSEERIFKTLMNLDRRCCCESFHTLFNSKSKRSCSRNINIENLEFKYIQPTCLVQCSGSKNKLNHSGFRFGSKESFVPSAIKTVSKQFRDEMKRNSSADINSRTSEYKLLKVHRSGKMFEQNAPGGDAEGGFDFQEEIRSLKYFCEKPAKKESKDNLVLSEAEDQLVTPRSCGCDAWDNKHVTLTSGKEYCPEDNTPKKNTSKFRKLKSFAKKCFCLGGTENSRDKNVPYRGKKNKSVKANLRRRLCSPNAGVIQMNEQGFLDRKREMNKEATYN